MWTEKFNCKYINNTYINTNLKPSKAKSTNERDISLLVDKVDKN